MGVFIPLITGFSGAITHVLSGPDHLAAVTPFSFEEKKKSWKIGLFWGLGHLTGMLLIGLLFLVFKEFFNLERFSGYSEFMVGFILTGIGIWAIYKALKHINRRKIPHIHENTKPFIHIHADGITHHEHHHSPEKNKSEKKITNTLSAFVVGTIHGFAGIAHFILFLPVLGFSSASQIITYIIGFGFGTVFAMVSYTYILSKITDLLKAEVIDKRMKYLRILSGILAIVIGLYWIFIN